MKENKSYDKCMEAVDFLKSKGFENPKFAIIFGSGLGNIENFEIIETLPYSEIPNFPESTVAGHSGNLLYGKVGEKAFVAQQGRFHYYEGYTGEEVVFGVRVMKLLGAETLLVSNAAGGVNPNFQVGDIMMINDHINMLPNPLIGPNDNRFGERFPDMTKAYDTDLIKKGTVISALNSMQLKNGVYFASTGPSFETPAEYEMIKNLGADSVGMSTTSEVIAARHIGMRVFGVSVITNEAHSFGETFLNSGKDVIEEGKKAASKVGKLFAQLIREA